MNKKIKVVKLAKNNKETILLGFFEDIRSATRAMEEHKDDKFWDGSYFMDVDIEKIDNAFDSDYSHFIASLIPSDEFKRVMMSDASAEIFADCMTCGNRTYYYLSRLIPKSWTVIDFGCAYNAQSYLFQDHHQYIGIEPVWNNSEFNFQHFQAPNTEIWFGTGQEFIRNELPKRELNLSKTFAICNYVPSDEMTAMVRHVFKNIYVFYPA